jgi:endoglucanase
VLWVKPPGESDGYCQGGPAPGEFWLEYALGLVKNRRQ